MTTPPRGARPGLRVTGGRWRGRTLLTLPGDAIRPTADRTRKALFDLLEGGRFSWDGGSPVVGAVVLDACCGTGALGLEALSRGAARLTLMDDAPASLRLAQANAAHLDAGAQLVRADVANPPPALDPCRLLLCDPPYDGDLASTAPLALAAAGWLAPGALIALETPDRAAASHLPGFEALEDRRYGRARIRLLRFQGDASLRF